MAEDITHIGRVLTGTSETGSIYFADMMIHEGDRMTNSNLINWTYGTNHLNKLNQMLRQVKASFMQSDLRRTPLPSSHWA